MALIVPVKTSDLGAGEQKKADPERLVSGDPNLTTWAQDESLDGRVLTGVWEATPGETRSVKDGICEFCHILEGVVEATGDDGGAGPSAPATVSS